MYSIIHRRMFFGTVVISLVLAFGLNISHAAAQTIPAAVQSACATQAGNSATVTQQGSVYTCTMSTGLTGSDSITLDKDGNVIKDAAGNQGSSVGDGGSATVIDKNGQIKPAQKQGPTSCSGTWNFITSPATCITRALFAGIGSFLLYIGVECLTASGLLFETILQYTVISFQTPMYASVQDAVNNAWTVFRDISNILIIGFFTFIAISTILGISEYGAKKLLSRVLIVAVLINFSLLFTKLIIDGSNFTAYQFYNASLSDVNNGAAYASGAANAQLANVQVAGATTNTESAKDKGIAGSFIQYLGVTGIADSYNNISAVQEANDSAVAGLVLGVLGFIFLIATALVFLYGSFILATRAILFIFLLITSSLAFATYLIPALSDNYGWSKWWKALLSNAILAPILMMMLWVTLTVSAGISSNLAQASVNGTGGHGTLGALIQNPTSAGNITALLNFVIILGLLFASFKLASKFSGGIVGFNVGGMALAALSGGTLGALAATSSSFARNTIGRSGAENSDRLSKQIAAKNLHLAGLDSGTAEHSKALREIENLRKQKATADKHASSDFNFMNNKLGKLISKKTGTAEAKSTGGFIEPRKKAAEEAAKAASDLVVSQADAAKAAGEKVRADIAKQTAALQSDKAASQNVIGTAQANAENEKQSSGAADQHRMFEQALKTTKEDAARVMTENDSKLLAGSRTAAEHDSLFNAQKDRIEKAEKAVGLSTQMLQNINDKHLDLDHIKAAQKKINAVDEQIKTLQSDAHQKAETSRVARTMVQNSTQTAAHIVGKEFHADPTTQRLIDKGVRKNIKTERLKDILTAAGEAKTESPEPPTTT